MKNKRLLSPHPHPPKRLLKNPPLLQQLFWQQQSLFSSCIFKTSLIIVSINYATSKHLVTNFELVTAHEVMLFHIKLQALPPELL